MTSSAHGLRPPLPARSLLPNLLSLSRVLLAPFAVRAVLLGQWRQAVVIFAAAGITDVLDGFLARWWRVSTQLGAYLDPAADKILLSATFVALGSARALPWWLVGIVLARDLLILAGAGVAMLTRRRRDFPPSVWGKLSTFLQSAAAGAAILARAWPETGMAYLTPPLIWLAAGGTVFSGLDYARRGSAAR